MSRLCSLGFFLIAVLSFSCDRKQTASTATQQSASARRTIAVIPKGTTHEFWKSIHAGAVKAGQESDAEIIWKGPLKEDDREEQIKVVDDFIARGVSGIVLAPLDDQALVVPVRNAARAGIPVVIIDSGLKAQDYSSLVATDNYKGGQIAGEEMARLLNDKGKVIVLRYAEGSDSTTKRENGFLDAIRKHPGIQIVSENQYGGVTTESAYQKSENMLTPLKTSDGSLMIDGIFTPCEPATFGMLRALQDGKVAGKVTFIGFDASDKLVQALRAGEIHGLILQNPFKIGYEGVKTMMQVVKNEKVEKRIDTGATLVTKANMEQPEMKELLNPPLGQYLKE
jgi:ribose transport system substrate-binding protein